MLKKFTVSNFKNFSESITLDLSDSSNYGFNENAVKAGLITKGLVYGINGSGKSNVGLALFDIIIHLTDKNRSLLSYQNYTNLNVSKSYAEFSYTFLFDGIELVYQYTKSDAQTILKEQLFIDNREMIYYDFEKKEGFTKLSGTETLNILGDSPISRVKYIFNNSILPENDENRAFCNFMDFVDHMLLFYSLETRNYMGFRMGREDVGEGIIKQGCTKAFEEFLAKHGIHYNLIEKDINGSKRLYCRFGDREVDFFSIASTGTNSLALFYYWYVHMRKASFVFMDEFDAFYHFELAEYIVEVLKDLTETQIILTTHNTDLLSNDLLRPDCYFKIENNQINTLNNLTEKELRKAHNLQKMFKAGAFNAG